MLYIPLKNHTKFRNSTSEKSTSSGVYLAFVVMYRTNTEIE